ncbi:MAG TPA: hypothetical protein EYH31_06125 [Anaerolineae bacterium]|nr:hypothetical protein [Anaerolineae bacterium]
MRYRPLGRTGLQVSEIGPGTVELGVEYGIPIPGLPRRPTEADAIRLVHRALDLGINFIDTARAYGESEAVLGKVLQGRRHRVILVTKLVGRGLRIIG